MFLKPYLLYFTDPVVDRLPLTPLAREGSMTKVCPNLDPVRIRAPYVTGHAIAYISNCMPSKM